MLPTPFLVRVTLREIYINKGPRLFYGMKKGSLRNGVSTVVYEQCFLQEGGETPTCVLTHFRQHSPICVTEYRH